MDAVTFKAEFAVGQAVVFDAPNDELEGRVTRYVGAVGIVSGIVTRFGNCPYRVAFTPWDHFYFAAEEIRPATKADRERYEDEQE